MTSSTLLPHNLVLRFRKTAGTEDSMRDARFLSSAATTRMDFLCLLRCGAGMGFSVVIGDVPPEGISMTGRSRS